MKIKTIPAGIYAANCYILMDEESKETAIIDPGGDAEDLKEAVEKLQGKVKFILLTHGHADHVGAVSELAKLYDAAIGINEKDEKISQKDYIAGSFYKKAEISLHDGQILKLGDKEIKCIETPGHTSGGMTFYINGMLFTGDTLFSGSIGRTDLGGGDFDTIISSIKTKLMILPDETIVLPGHGPQSTIKKERIGNPFL
ncbi:MAG: MBL fold metallo-hydrolase [Clostridiaceae bacterium]